MSRASGGYKGSLRRSRGDRGQSLVEFALVFPIFFTLLLGLIEFAFVFNAILAMNYAARDAALSAAEAGDRSGADCIILDSGRSGHLGAVGRLPCRQRRDLQGQPERRRDRGRRRSTRATRWARPGPRARTQIRRP